MKSVSDSMSVFVKNVRILGAMCELISNVKVRLQAIPLIFIA